MDEKTLDNTDKKVFEKIDKEDRRKIIDEILIDRKPIFDALDD
ncbi:hypothetical protein LCGC14_2701140 [marine sediment metagenome]|uniref:Uncharacterized protein n=1 Tax=marine sediment metagenome TaxID=412755 RepID=A0A0F8ZFT9_9ZZZZ